MKKKRWSNTQEPVIIHNTTGNTAWPSLLAICKVSEFKIGYDSWWNNVRNYYDATLSVIQQKQSMVESRVYRGSAKQRSEGWIVIMRCSHKIIPPETQETHKVWLVICFVNGDVHDFVLNKTWSESQHMSNLSRCSQESIYIFSWVIPFNWSRILAY